MANTYIDEQSKKAYAKADKTKEGKDYAAETAVLNEYVKQLHAAHGPSAQLLISKEEGEYLNKLAADYHKKAKEFFYTPEYKNEFAGKLIQDMGYTDTISGRKYVEKVLNEINKKNPDWN